MKAIIKVDVPEWQTGQEVSIYFPDTMTISCKNCGYKSNDDRIGAMNLHRMGINLLVPDAVVTE